jgi:hypothetical protein
MGVSGSGSALVTESFTPYGWWRDAGTWAGPASNVTTIAGYSRKGYTFQNMLEISPAWCMNGRSRTPSRDDSCPPIRT